VTSVNVYSSISLLNLIGVSCGATTEKYQHTSKGSVVFEIRYTA